jgi:putative membrane protein insertion efficiency factor
MIRLPQRFLILLVRGYRLLLSPWLGSSCRFEPTCSAYAQQALERHGALAGSALAAGRVLRCHPGCAGGHDPVPEQLAGWLARRRPPGAGRPVAASSPFPFETKS